MKKKKNAIIIEKMFRCFHEKEKYKKLKQSSKIIANFYKKRKEFVIFNKYLLLLLFIIIRRCKKRKMNTSATKIQSLIRMFIKRKKYTRV